ncbi:winged helix DNA-binding protein [Streptomyces sp. NPDC059352]|uniref:winged helix DNA-binding protein n=1 Tax=Streptomyces sp. NPDC059352 TaxID=3346810 RepID=UPI0036C8264A
MDQPYAVVGISNVPTDWAAVFRSLAGSDLTLVTVPGAALPTSPGAASDRADHDGTGHHGTGPGPVAGAPSMRMTPPSVLDLHAYLLTAIGKAARRRLTDKLAARGLRLWHLTVMALLGDLGPQMKTVLAARLDMNASDLVKIVNDLEKAGHVDCVRDPADRRRVVVRLTAEGRSSLAALSAEIATADDEILAPLDTAEREQLASLLRRVHSHLEPAPAGVVHERPSSARSRRQAADIPVQTHSVEDGRVDWTRPAESIARLVDSRRHAHPAAYTHHDGRRLDILGATVSRHSYAGTPGLVLHTEDEGVVVVTGTEAHTGRNHGLALTLLRTDEGREVAPEECFGPADSVLADESGTLNGGPGPRRSG